MQKTLSTAQQKAVCRTVLRQTPAQAGGEGHAGTAHAHAHAEDVTLAVLLGLGVDRARAEELVAAPLPDVDIGHGGRS